MTKALPTLRFRDAPREKCGIFAASGLEQAAELAFLGLYALQHRGQESAGIAAWSDDGRMRLHRGMGLVAEVFSQDRLRGLPGKSAIGHVRYSTYGDSILQNAQPLHATYREGELALAHNGNLTNAGLLRTELVTEGAIFQTTIDTEVIVHLIARSQKPSTDDQIEEALTQVEGAFSLLILLNDTLYAARDSYGFRPLVLGRKGRGLLLASETCAFDLMGAQYMRDVAPGEILKIRDGEIVEQRWLPKAEPAACIFELVYFSRPDSKVWGASVDRARRAFGRQLAREHPAEADLVFSVPDSSNSAALGYAEESGLPLELALIRNHYVGRTFIQPTQAGRDFQVRIKYNPVREVLEGKRVVMVDDSLVRGTTSRGLVRMIREAGATQVHVRVASPPIISPCFYGIDMPTRKELAAASHSVEEIRQMLGVDSLGYLSHGGMINAVREFGPFCDACFTGNYPAPLADLERGYSLATCS